MYFVCSLLYLSAIIKFYFKIIAAQKFYKFYNFVMYVCVCVYYFSSF